MYDPRTKKNIKWNRCFKNLNVEKQIIPHNGIHVETESKQYFRITEGVLQCKLK